VVVVQMHRAGVRIVTGSDMSAYLIHPGFWRQEEIQRLSGANPLGNARKVARIRVVLLPRQPALRPAGAERPLGSGPRLTTAPVPSTMRTWSARHCQSV
jgi:hypothetical protein